MIFSSRDVTAGDEVVYRAAAVEYDCPTFGTAEAGNVTAAEFVMRNVLNYEALAIMAAEEVREVMMKAVCAHAEYCSRLETSIHAEGFKS